MPPPVMQFQPQSAEPFLQGANAGLLQQQMQEAALNNRILAAKAQYAGPLAQAALQEAQAQPQLTAAQAAQANAAAGLGRANTALIQGQTPYLIQQERGKIFADPMMQRLYELQQAARYGVDTTALRNIPNNGNQNQTSNNPLNPLNLSTQSPSGSTYPYSNYVNFDSIYNPIQMEQLKHQAATQGSTNVNQYTDSLADAQKEAMEGNELNLSANQFSRAYDNSRYKGGLLGTVPTTGWESALARAYDSISGKPDMSAEQEADKAASALSLDLTKAQNLGRFTNQELETVKKANVGRPLDEGAKQQLVNFLQQKGIRMQEKLPFMNAAQKAGIDAPTAQSLWNMYNLQRPVYDFKNDKPNTQYINSYRDYFTPEMIAAARSGIQGNPQGGTSPQTAPPSADNSNLMKPLPLTAKQTSTLNTLFNGNKPQSQNAANQSKFSDADIAYTAQKYHMTIAQVKQRMKQMGIQ